MPRSITSKSTPTSTRSTPWPHQRHGASFIGTPIPEAATFVQYLPGGNALHLHGCNRIGTSVTDSVADSNCKAWGVNNLYLGGNGVIPKGIGCNPTLTSVALALRASMDILGLDTSDTFHTPVE